MDPFEIVDLGSTGLKVTRLGLGGAPLGSPPPRLEDGEAVETIRRALSLGMRYVDTATYGQGRSELRYGEALTEVPRDSYVISTKVGRLLKKDGVEDVDFGSINLANLPELEAVFDFSRDAVLRAFEHSLQRLRLDSVDILLLHDVPHEHYQTAIDEGFPALAELRSQEHYETANRRRLPRAGGAPLPGVVSAIGAGLAPLDLLLRFVRDADFDCFILPNRYTLTEQTAIDEFLSMCQERGIAIILGAPYNQGRMLGPGRQTAEAVAHLRRYEDICDKHGVPIRAAALQFVVAHPAVVTVIPGPASIAEMTDNIRMTQHSCTSSKQVGQKGSL